MKTFTTIALTCCLITVIALQVTVLRNQNRPESVVPYQPVDRAALPQIQTVSYSVEEGQAAAEAGTEEPSWKTRQANLNFAANKSSDEGAVLEPAIIPDNPFADAAPANEPLLSFVPVDSEPAVGLLDSEPAPATLQLGPPSAEPLVGGFAGTEPGVVEVFSQPESAPSGSLANKQEPEVDDPRAAPDSRPEEEQQPDPELAKYPIWLLIKPDGVQFLQTQEEIATNRHTIPPNAFLIGCRSATFKAGAFDEFAPAGAAPETERNDSQRTFNLSCDVFTLKGRYGTRQQIEVTGATLSFSTASQQIHLHADKPQPLEFHSWDESAENRMQADEITLQLHADGFQMSAEGASGVEINPNPDPKKQPKPTPKAQGFSTFPEGSPFG